jgi:hypothetical protein
MDLQASSWLGSEVLLELTEKERSDSVDGQESLSRSVHDED